GSTLLPIANPANLIFFAGGMPPLRAWLAAFGLATIAALACTYLALVFIFRRDLGPPLRVNDGNGTAPRRAASVTLVAAALILVATAELQRPLGATTFVLAIAAMLVGTSRDRAAPLAIARGVAWPVVLLTAGLFVIVEALDRAGAAGLTRAVFAWAASVPAPVAKLTVAGAAAAASNLINNLPVSLELGGYVAHAHPSPPLAAAALAGVNVGPNFSVTGSLATLLWLAILRRAGVRVSALRFAGVGIVATPLALATAALLAR
ncbi:MAG: arsenic transporter, partial [Candidatus Eremiobacteraeota bacterium]|nr:arsenic transporter [Candidatus Eremiobacteraeota bacterium]